jgi:dihydropteroate synthase
MALPFRVMGIINVTPDSFSDGGRYLDPRTAIAHGVELARQGADILDVGGESTRPGAEPVTLREELSRVVPVVEGLAERLPGVQISIDTSKSQVAERALAAGASLVNDVSALRGDPQMATVVASSGADCCLMHMAGEPRTMQRDPHYENVVQDVRSFLQERVAFAVAEGVREERIMIDPGIGFGKTIAHNLELLRRLDELVSVGRPIAIGTSRKSFIGAILAQARGQDEPAAPGDRLQGTSASCVLALERGASVFRVHDVAAVRDALAMAAATLHGAWTKTNKTSPTSS